MVVAGAAYCPARRSEGTLPEVGVDLLVATKKPSPPFVQARVCRELSV